MAWEQYVDFMILLVREGAPRHDVASVFSIPIKTLYSLLYQRGYKINELKKMSPLPQEERNRIIQKFCERKSRVKRLSRLLDSYGIQFEDFVSQPLLLCPRHPQAAHRSVGLVTPYVDLIFLLLREGIKACDIALAFSVVPENICGLVKSHGFSITELKNMPPMPLNKRIEVIQKFCETPENEKKLRAVLDLYGMRVEDFAAQSFLKLSKSTRTLNRHADFIIFLVREGIWVRNIATAFSVSAGVIREFLYSRGFRLMELKNMPSMPLEERRKTIQEFCETPSNLEKLRTLLDSYGIGYEDFLSRSFRAYLGNGLSDTVETHIAFMHRNVEIVERRRKGETLESISRTYGLSRERIRQIVCRYNRSSENPIDIKEIKMQTRLKPPPETLELRKKILELCQSGLTYQQVADTLEIPKHHVTQLVYAYNSTVGASQKIRRPYPQKVTSTVRENIVKERKKGFTVREITEKFNISAVTVNRILKEAGLTKPRPWVGKSKRAKSVQTSSPKTNNRKVKKKYR